MSFVMNVKLLRNERKEVAGMESGTPVKNRVITERLSRLRRWMKEEGIHACMIPSSDPHQSEYVHDHFKVREYFSGFSGSNGTLVVAEKEAGLWTDGRYFIQAEKELSGTSVTLFKMQEEGVPELSDYLYQTLKEGQTLGFDGRSVSATQGLALEKKLGAKGIRLAYDKDPAILWEDRPALPAHEIFCLPKELCGEDGNEKLAQVRERMEQEEAQGLFLSRLDDLMWLFNVRGTDVACNPVALSYGFLTREEAYFFVRKAALTQDFISYAHAQGIILEEYGKIRDFLAGFAYDGTVWMDPGNSNYTLFKTVEARVSILRKKNPTELLKAVKNPVELSRMERVYVKDSLAVTRFIYWIKKNAGRPGLTETLAAEHLDGLRRKTEGFLDLSFPTISAYGANAAMMHYEAVPGQDCELRAQGMLLVDSGGQYMGGTTDVTRTIVLGEISDEIRKHFTKVAVGMLRLSDARFLSGCSGRNLDILARGPLWDLGIDYKCGTGHGIGYILNVHEGPQSIRFRFAEGVEETALLEGMVLSNEPGVYREGSHGIRTENVIVVKKGEKNRDGQFMHFDTLTFVPIDRDGMDPSFMEPEDIRRFDAYHAKVYEKLSPFLEGEELVWLKEATGPLCKSPVD